MDIWYMDSTTEYTIENEYQRITKLVKSKQIDTDSTLVLAEIDGLVQFFRADFIPFFYCSGERVEELLDLMV
jgi:hypothetical protein